MRRDGKEGLRGTGALPGVPTEGDGYGFALANEGRRPGCDHARSRPPIPKLDTVLAGNVDTFSLLIVGTDAVVAVESVGEDGFVDGGADVFVRRCEMVPIIGDVLINGLFVGVAMSERTEKVDPPRGRGVVNCEM